MNGEMSLNTVMISEARMHELVYIEQHSEQIIRDVVAKLVQDPNQYAAPVDAKRNRDAAAQQIPPARSRTRGR
jgi:hypothetical protein